MNFRILTYFRKHDILESFTTGWQDKMSQIFHLPDFILSQRKKGINAYIQGLILMWKILN